MCNQKRSVYFIILLVHIKRARQEKQNNIIYYIWNIVSVSLHGVHITFLVINEILIVANKKNLLLFISIERKKQQHSIVMRTTQTLRDILFLRIVNCSPFYLFLTMNTQSLVPPRDTNSDRTQIRIQGSIDLASLTRIVSVWWTTTRYDCAYREWSILSRQIKARRSN